MIVYGTNDHTNFALTGDKSSLGINGLGGDKVVRGLCTNARGDAAASSSAPAVVHELPEALGERVGGDSPARSGGAVIGRRARCGGGGRDSPLAPAALFSSAATVLLFVVGVTSAVPAASCTSTVACDSGCGR